LDKADKAAIARSLELLGERCGDPAPLVYRRLFADRPELEALFVRDTAGSVRGQMLAMVIDTVLDLAGANAYAARMIDSERVSHAELGVPATVFDGFFAVLMRTCREELAADWTPAMDRGWAGLLAGALPGRRSFVSL
jgi:hemoglobin-like flavoprotein